MCPSLSRRLNTEQLRARKELTRQKRLFKKRAIREKLRRERLIEESKVPEEIRMHTKLMGYIKDYLKERISAGFVVKDESEKEIDLAVVIENLEHVKAFTLKYLCKALKNSKGFNRRTTRLLLGLYKYFTTYGKVFTFKYLQTNQQMLEAFEKRLEYPQYVNSRYRCDQCNYGFNSQKCLIYHISQHHDERHPVVCHICHYRVISKKTLRRHMLYKHCMIYTCKLCPDFVTDSKSVMMNHYDNNHNDLGYECTCEYCGLVFSNYRALAQHSTKIHRGNYVCVFCAQTFREKGIGLHIKKLHKFEEFVEGPHNATCDVCNITFINDEVYRKHLNISHAATVTNNDPYGLCTKMRYRCEFCNGRFKYIRDRGLHYATVHEGLTPQCSVKKQKINTFDASLGKTRYPCPICDKKVLSLNTHLETHSAARDFQCSHCPKRFRTQSLLNLHVKWHLPPTLKCKYCDKMFHGAANLRAHYMMHENNRYYKCQYCPKDFTVYSNLKEHINGVHFKMPRKRMRREKQD